MMEEKNHIEKQTSYWFKRKRFGWGYVPVTWQGWMLIAAYVLVITLAATAFLDGTPGESAFFILIFILATAGLFQISFRKGPWPRWRWGKKPDDNPDEDF